MKRRFPWMVAVLTVTCLVFVTGIGAGEKTHTVRSGESASSIARQHYGNLELGDFLLRYNGKAGTVIRPGEKLRIPSCELHKVESGDSWSGLARKYLGKTDLYPALAALNGFASNDVLRVGEPIVIPVVLSHTLEKGEALASLAERYYGDPKRADLLQVYNGIEDPRRLSVGQTVEIPLVSIRLQKSRAAEVPGRALVPVGNSETPQRAQVEKKPPVPKTPSAGQAGAGPEKTVTQETRPVPEPVDSPVTKSVSVDPPVSKPEAPAPSTSSRPDSAEPERTPLGIDREIRQAARAFASGDFERAQRILEPLSQMTRSAGSDREKQDVLRLLAFVHIAFDRLPEACDAYRSLAGTAPPLRLDPDLVSPKIRKTLAGCT